MARFVNGRTRDSSGVWYAPVFQQPDHRRQSPSHDNPDFILIDLNPRECPFDKIVDPAVTPIVIV
jgi:hypothetical protein